MFDTAMYDHIQQYRLNWYAARKTVEENDDVDVDAHHAHMNYHITTKQWVIRLNPLDSVENAYQDIWHERTLGDFDGLKHALESGLLGDDSDPLDVQTLTEIGKAAEEISVDAMDLPEHPPVDVEPWTPRPTSEIKTRLEELRQEIPTGHEFDNEL